MARVLSWTWSELVLYVCRSLSNGLKGGSYSTGIPDYDGPKIEA